MKRHKNIVGEKINLLEIKGLVEVYEEIAAGKMQLVRGRILTRRQYVEELAAISEEVGADFSGNQARLPDGQAAVLLTGQGGLYGDLPEKIFLRFVEFVKKEKTDVYVAGDIGLKYMREWEPKIAVTPLVVPETATDLEIGVAVTALSRYQRISLFYGKFKNIAVQEVGSQRFSGDFTPKLATEELAKRRFVNIYEPTVEAVSQMFGRQILAALMAGMTGENELANYAARLMHLDSALNNIEEKLGVLSSDLRRSRKRREDKKQRERLATVGYRDGSIGL